MLKLKNVVLVRDKKTILHIDDFQLAEGEMLAVIGPNGAGKSTLLKVLALLEEPTEGEIFFRGERVTGKNALSIRRRMAVVFQEPLLLNTTVFNNVAQGLKFRGVAGPEIERRVNYWLERLGISGLRNRTPLHLSGGEAQRVGLARAFVLEPEVIFLDEPFSALDFPTRVDLLEQLSELLANTGTTAVFVTHDFTEIPYLTGNVAVVDGGTVVYRGKLKEIMKEAASIPVIKHLLKPLQKSMLVQDYFQEV
ncbi:ABC transporter ATP-binding protein [Desulfallas sp. Bu1-1]|uniref:ABC transporter ATP-binding protein n=1 Tax=Desulfallas sp. Bu1-1 TaxID=2787620 RepID=UPI00189E0E91|nr:ABC transporter ATP-binding protein [Desulfallas sp. Bu1-1]MBF7084658.1 ABC transporter ATP-binding protein [Desulfallas sp. Bu1-1]